MSLGKHMTIYTSFEHSYTVPAVAIAKKGLQIQGFLLMEGEQTRPGAFKPQ